MRVEARVHLLDGRGQPVSLPVALDGGIQISHGDHYLGDSSEITVDRLRLRKGAQPALREVADEEREEGSSGLRADIRGFPLQAYCVRPLPAATDGRGDGNARRLEAFDFPRQVLFARRPGARPAVAPQELRPGLLIDQVRIGI